MSSARDFINYALKIKAMELIPEGRELKSKRLSYHFFNSGNFNDGHSLCALARAYAGAIMQHELHPNVIFGKSYKGNAIAVATVMELARCGMGVGWAYDRKEVKDHGEGGRIVGMPLKGKKVLSVDDVVTTGSSQMESRDIIIGEGGIFMGCVIAFDRQEYGADKKRTAVQALWEDLQAPVYPASTLQDLIDELSDGIIPGSYPVLEKILEYKKQYCLPD